MEKPQLDRREKIALAIFLGAVGAVALQANKDGKRGVARLYPGGSVFIDIIKDAKSEASTRLAYLVEKINPPKFDFGGTEHTDEELQEIEDIFDINNEQE